MSISDSIVDKMTWVFYTLCYWLLVSSLAYIVILYFSSMASMVTLLLEYVYIVIRIKIVVDYCTITPSVVVCHYGETNDVFLIARSLLRNETFVACDLRHCNHWD